MKIVIVLKIYHYFITTKMCLSKNEIFKYKNKKFKYGTCKNFNTAFFFYICFIFQIIQHFLHIFYKVLKKIYIFIDDLII